MARVITVDPGFSLGWAMWEWAAVDEVEPCFTVEANMPPRKRTPAPAVWRPRQTGVLHAPEPEHPHADAWVAKAILLGDGFRSLLEYQEPDYVFCEEPTYMEASAKGRASARAGSLVTLAYTVGVLAANVHALDIAWYLIGVNQWKGQLPKAEVVQRIYDTLGVTYPNHIADAVGIGLHLQGVKLFK